jgi:hypothetical protein
MEFNKQSEILLLTSLSTAFKIGFCPLHMSKSALPCAFAPCRLVKASSRVITHLTTVKTPRVNFLHKISATEKIKRKTAPPSERVACAFEEMLSQAHTVAPFQLSAGGGRINKAAN